MHDIQETTNSDYFHVSLGETAMWISVLEKMVLVKFDTFV